VPLKSQIPNVCLILLLLCHASAYADAIVVLLLIFVFIFVGVAAFTGVRAKPCSLDAFAHAVCFTFIICLTHPVCLTHPTCLTHLICLTHCTGWDSGCGGQLTPGGWQDMRTYSAVDARPLPEVLWIPPSEHNNLPCAVVYRLLAVVLP
jgi:hypothetical protein